MAEPHVAALSKATVAALTASSEPWADRVYKDFAPLNTSGGVAVPRPYVVMMLAGGGNEGVIRADFANLIWQVKAVGNTQASAYDCAARIRALLQNADLGTTKALDGGDDWHILSVHEEMAIDMSELVGDGTQRIYHAGARYRVLMQSKTVI